MKKLQKILSIILTVLTLVSVLSCAMPVWAADMEAYTKSKAYNEALLSETVDNANDKAEIVSEITEKRNEYSKTYKRADGSYTTIFSQAPLHIYENGVWREINNELQANGKVIENTDGKFSVEFPETISENEKISVTNGEESIAFSVDGISESSAVTHTDTNSTDILSQDIAKPISGITYENIGENTDIEYIVTPDSVKENIIVENKESLKASYTFTIDKGNLIATFDSENNLIFSNEKGENVFRIPAPVMKDNAGNISYDIAVNAENLQGEAITLTYTPSKEWLTDTGRAYPVIIDPVIELPDLDDTIIEDTVIINDTADTASKTTNYSNSAEGVICDTSEKTSHVLVKLNMDVFSALADANIAVTEVNYCATGYVTGGNIIAKPVNGSWNSQTVTYADVFPQEAEATITYGDEITDFYTGNAPEENGTSGKICLNITDLFNQWLKGTRANDGFAVIPESSSVTGGLVLAGDRTVGNTTYSFETYCTVDYVDTSCVSDGYEYITQEIGRAGTANINVFTRGLSLTRSDLSMNGLRMPVSIDFNYSSAVENYIELYADIMGAAGEGAEITAPYGNNWMPSYLYAIFTVTGEQYQVLTGEGTVAVFNYKSETTDGVTTRTFEEDESGDSGYSLELVDAENGCDYDNLKLITPSGETVYFDSYGFAYEIHEAEANADGTYDKISIVYDSGNQLKIDYVTDGIGRKYDFIYSNETDLLTEINCLTADGTQIKAGTTDIPLKVAYAYNNGNLTSVTYPDGKSIAYTYDSNGSLVYAGNIDNYSINYTYDTLGKVTGVSEHVGSTAGNNINLYELSNRQVKVVDGYSGTQTYQFGKDGKLNYTFDKNGNYYKSDYAPSTDENVYSSYDWRIQSQNLLKNGSFEDVTNSKADNWTNSFTVVNTESDYLCRLTSTEATTALQSQTVAVSGGKSYTFSLDVKSYLAETSADDKLYIRITATDESGEDELSKARNITLTNEFEQYSISVNTEFEIATVKVEFGFNNKKGDFAVNNAQLEKGNGTAEYNYVENGNFTNGTDKWSTATLVDESINDEAVKALKLSGGLPSYTSDGTLTHNISSVTQNVKINGKKGDVYSVGGWFKGKFDDNAVNTITATSQQLTNSTAQIKVTYTYTDTVTETAGDGTETTTEQTVTESFAVDFAPRNDGWQYANDSFALKGDVQSVDVTVIAKNILNDSYATGIELTKDEESTLIEYENEELVEEASYFTEESSETNDSCICENCEEFNCECRCASESICTCVQCNRSTTKEYDAYGNLTSTVKSDGILTMTTESTYSADGNYLAGTRDENDVVSTFTESAQHDTSSPLFVSVAGQGADYTYDAGTHLDSVTKNVSGLSSGNRMQVQYTYDDDRITSVTHNGYSYNFEYDDWGNIAIKKVNNQTIAQYIYGTQQYNRQLKKIMYENGQSIWYDYDSLGNVSGIKYSIDSDWRFTMDYTNSQKTSITDTVQNYLKEITETNYTITDLTTDQVIYNKTDSTETYYGVQYSKTINDEVYTQTDGTTLQSSVLSGIANSTKSLATSKLTDWFGRDSADTITINNADSTVSLEKEFKYKSGTQQNATTKYIEEISNTIKNNDSVNSAETLKYTYDIYGNIKTVSNCVNNTTTLQCEYYYDEANQIVRVDDYVNSTVTIYQYDIGGNIVSAKNYSLANYSAESDVLSEDIYVYDNSWKDRLSSVNGKALTYDLIGNLLTYNGKTHTWVAGRKLATFQNADYSLSFNYDENGLRSSKTVTHNGITKTFKYIWVDDKLIGQTDGTDTLRFIYNDNDEVLGFIRNDTEIYLYIKNIFGDIIGIVDESGNVVVNYTYDVWGKLLSVSGTLAETIGQLNPIRYRGYYYDSESGYYYLQSRYYDPELRRFINADKLETLYSHNNTYLYADSVNTFSYCDNSPVNMVDYSGEKKASNSGYTAAYAFIFVVGLSQYQNAITIKSDKYSKGDLYINSKKGKIEVNLSYKKNKVELSDYLNSFYFLLDNKVYDTLALLALRKFEEEFVGVHNKAYGTDPTVQRPFLFSQSCVSNEIKLHDYAYRMFRSAKPGAMQNNIAEIVYIKLGVKISNRTGNVDILEQDALKSFDKNAFNYFDGIASCYKSTTSDPYWDGKIRKKTYERPRWRTSQILYNA